MPSGRSWALTEKWHFNLAMPFFHAILRIMVVTIDSAGRIVVPKPVRERLGLRKDSKLELEETADGIVLKPVENEPLWRRSIGTASSTKTAKRVCERSAAGEGLHRHKYCRRRHCEKSCSPR